MKRGARNLGMSLVLCLALAGTGLAGGGCAGEQSPPPDASSTTLAPSTTTSYVGPSTTTPPDTGETPFPETFILSFVGPVSSETWTILREIVIAAGDDGQQVLDEAAKMAVGPPVELGVGEPDAVRGVGYTAGASGSQPIATAAGTGGAQVIVMAFTVSEDPDATTIVGFERETHRVVLVVGPLPIDDSTPNMTTIPGP